MKRELTCSIHGEEIKEICDDEDTVGEKYKIVKGKLKCSGLVCDVCNKELVVGEEVYAISTWSTRSGIPYSPWEKLYLIETI